MTGFSGFQTAGKSTPPPLSVKIFGSLRNFDDFSAKSRLKYLLFHQYIVIVKLYDVSCVGPALDYSRPFFVVVL